jgi:tol-pal system protein YbgF
VLAAKPPRRIHHGSITLGRLDLGPAGLSFGCGWCGFPGCFAGIRRFLNSIAYLRQLGAFAEAAASSCYHEVEGLLMLRTMRKHFAAAAILAAVLACAPPPAHAVSKEIIQLQTQVQQLLDMVQNLQSSFDTRFGVLQNLAQQTANQATQMSGAVADLQKKLDSENEATSGKVDAVSGQIQSLNDSVDELRTRIDKLQQSVQKLQTQLQNIQAPPPTAMPGAAPNGMEPNGEPGQPNGQPDQQTPNGAPSAGPQGMNMTGQPQAPATLPAQAQAPPLRQTYEGALNDFNAGRYKMAEGEFQQVVKNYPYDDTAGSAQFYLGEIAYRQHEYSKAIDAYNAMLETYPGNPLAPTAELHKAYALLDARRRTDGIRELRQLIQRYPRTPEASRARQKLDGMGVRIVPH